MMILSVIPDIYYNDTLNLVREFFYEHYLSQSMEVSTARIAVKIDEESHEVYLSYQDFERDCTLVDSFAEENVFEETESKHKKNSIKRCLVRLLSSVRKENLPWGILTGIRPVKIVHMLVDKGCSFEEIKAQLRSYYISETNIRRMINIALLQRDSVYPLDKKKVSLYIHIPFCPSRCAYCSFHTMIVPENREIVKRYLAALRREMEAMSEEISKLKIDTIYIGGGTPTTLNDVEFEKLFGMMASCFDLSKVREWTVEAGRPDSISMEQLQVLKQWNVSRISINPQTMNEHTLLKINRRHTVDDIYHAFEMVRSVGFKCINTDLIIGLEDETPKDFQNTLSHVSSLNPENLTIHTLSLKRGSKYKDSYVLRQIEDVRQMTDDSRAYCNDSRLRPYYLYRQKDILGNLENVGYAKTGYECIYNMLMMEEKQTILAFGMGAISKFFDPKSDSIQRVANFKNMKEYINRIEEEIVKKRKGLNQLYEEGLTCMKK